MIFKVINGFPDYEIYADGRIIRAERVSKNGKYMKRKVIAHTVAKNGYRTVRLADREGNHRQFYVHRLIYTVFVGEIEGYEIDHIDGNRSNNNLNNLRAVTHTENCKNPISIEKYKKANALSNGKFDRNRMMMARGIERYNKLKDIYRRLYREKGRVGIFQMMKEGHCGYPRAQRLVREMEKERKMNINKQNNA